MWEKGLEGGRESTSFRPREEGRQPEKETEMVLYTFTP